MNTTIIDDVFEFVYAFVIALVVGSFALVTCPVWIPFKIYKKYKFNQWRKNRSE